ncbi:DNA-3-methyladenine glycosylase 2 family protein [Thalassotalea ganghwensis]
MLDPQICEQARLSRDARFDGKFYTAVLTTGIFCRPICPARPPKPENVVYYQSAEQAQSSGFRPCKRCFPEFAPELNIPILLKHIISHYDYSCDTISSTAKTYNISERQLNRLFNQYLGVSPITFFQQQRLLLARKLLTKTTLSITDSCYASGFNSLRRFNEAIKNAYQQTPSELRANQEPTLSRQNVTLALYYRPPFDWPLMLSFFKDRQISGIELVDNESYRRTIWLDACYGWLEVKHHPDKHALLLTVNLSDYRYLNQVISRVRRMFDLDADMSLIHKSLSSHPILAQTLKKYSGLRLPGSWDFFEFSIRAILGQQVSVKAATTFAQRIAEKYGRKLVPTNDLSQYQLCGYFPTINDLLTADLREIGLTSTRRQTLQRWVAFYHHNHKALLACHSGEQLSQLISPIKGIGPWTINYMAMRGLSDPDAFPSADLGVIKALNGTIAKDENSDKLSQKQIIAQGDEWRPWRSYATLLLWHSLH